MEVHRAGDLDRAKQLYRQHLATRPRDAAALHLLGFAEFQSLRFDRAVELIGSAVALRPENAEFQNNLALAHLAAGEFELARRHAQEAKRLGHADGHGYWHVGVEYFQRRQLTHAERAIQLALFVEPTSPEAHNCLGVVYGAQQRYDDAEASYRRALELRPTYVEALNNLGNALRDQNRLADSIPYYQRALDLAPGFAAAHNNLGIALVNSGQTDEGIACYQRALRLQPDYAEAVNNLANAVRDLGRLDEAVDHYRRALQLQPDSAEIQCNLGVGLRRLGELPEAVGYFRRAIVLQPSSTKIHYHLASALVEQGQLNSAVKCFRHVARLDPRQSLWRMLAALVCPTVFLDRDEMAAYWQSLSDEIAAVRREDFSIDFNEFTNIAAAAPFNLQFFERCIRGLKEDYAALFTAKLDAAYRSTWVDSWRGPTGRPRVGFVVTEDHEGIFLKSLRGVIERISAKDFELVVFCSARGESRLQTTIARDDLRLVRLPSRFERIVETIDEAHCDLLYYWEVGTDTFNYFLPFLRLAPIQFTSWGIQVTSGIPSLDYYVSNEHVEPPDAHAHYTERLVLARTFLTFRERTLLPHMVRPRESFALPAHARWYVCAQQLGKFHIDFDKMLSGILHRDEQGIIVITGDKTGQNASRLQQRFRAMMPEVADRIHFLPRMETTEYVSLLQHADVLLDPPHFGGVNSTYDGLSLGKAIVVLPSAFHRGRYTLGCFRKMALTDCIAQDASDYSRLAVRLATEREYRRDVEQRIYEASEVLFEDGEAVSEHERIFHELLNAR